MAILGKYSFGIGDRFAHQGEYQLQAFIDADNAGAIVTPVWNKSNREHKTVKSTPESVREEANNAVKNKGWTKSYLVDADHINMETVDSFISSSDFFTIDVANKIGEQLSDKELEEFLSNNADYLGTLNIPGVEEAFEVNEDALIQIANTFSKAVSEAKAIYNHIKSAKGGEEFAVEVSMDEVNDPQSPLELFFILKLLGEANIPVNTVAPKFTGRFNKGVDYEGDIKRFEKEFEEDLLVIKYAVKEFGLPGDLKLSVHTGSDKFSLYPIINKLIKKHDTGLHLKTAGTTWLEEVIGLAESEGSGLEMAKEIYLSALDRYDELTVPYDTVLNIDRSKLPAKEEISSWNGDQFSTALRHDQQNDSYNPHFRQLIHTAYKVAAEKGDDFLNELKKNAEIIGKNVYQNIFERHIKPLYIN